MLRAACVVVATAVTAAAAPLPDLDPLLPGTKWVGTLTQRGTFAGGGQPPPAFKTVLTVTRRDGNRFEGELDEAAGPIQVTYQVKGTIEPAGRGRHAVRFRSVGATRAELTEPVLDVPYAGLLTGRVLAGTWKVTAGRGGANVEGDFALELGR